jgi:hypothetical protein
MVCCTSCFGGGGGADDDTKERIILIKGPYCFVFNKETDAAPKYAIALAHMKATTAATAPGGGGSGSNSGNSNKFRVTIETSMGDPEWELTFERENLAKQFVDCLRQQARIGEAEKVRKVRRERLVPYGTAVVFAFVVGRSSPSETHGNRRGGRPALLGVWMRMGCDMKRSLLCDRK